MKRTLKILLTITILILSLVGCTEKADIDFQSLQGTDYESQESQETEESRETEEEYVSIDSSEYTDNDDSEDENLIGLYQMEDYTLYDYIAGAAIIDYKMGGEHIRALVDQDGSFISELGPETFFTSDRDPITGACYSDQRVMDVEGNIIFTVEDGQSILCVGDSMILVYEKAVGFENAESKIGVVSFDGEWLQPMTSDNLMINDEKTGLRRNYCWRYAGEGCFLVDNDEYSRSPGLSMNRYETVIYDVYNKTSSIYDGKITYGFCDGVAANFRANIFIDRLGNIVKESSDSIYPIGDGMYYNSSQKTLCYYSGEIIKDYNKYENAQVTNFKNGHGYFEAEGADGDHYFSVIDSNGDFLFEPIHIRRERNGFMGDFYNGEFIADEQSFDLSGNMIFDFSEVAYWGDIISCYEGIAIVELKSKEVVYMTMHGEVIEPMIPQN